MAKITDLPSTQMGKKFCSSAKKLGPTSFGK